MCHSWKFYGSMPKQRMLCKCCYDLYELVERLYALVQLNHGLIMLQMDGDYFMDLSMGDS